MAKHFSQQDFINKAIQVHGNVYDYSKVEYINSKTKVCIICPIHGEFWQESNSHLQGRGCPYCANVRKLSNKEFIEKAKKIHGDKYDYSKVEYVNSQIKVCIICPKHGEFFQTPNCHLNGQGCPKCKAENFGKSRKGSLNEFIEKAIQVHGNVYDYSKVEYNGSLSLVTIICRKHGEFSQKPSYHLMGHGCPICKESKLEKTVRTKLSSEGFVFETNKKFTWLGKQHLDFYLPKYNIAIECQGEQHFEPIKYFGGVEKLKRYQELDFIKHEKCLNNGIVVLYFSSKNYLTYFNNDIYKNNIYFDVDSLLKAIKGVN